MVTKSATQPVPIVARPFFWGAAWFIAWFGARIALESPAVPTWGRVIAALAPTPIAAAALLTIVRAARELDELEQRIQLEALAVAFVLAVLLLMTLGLLELAVTLNRDDWSYRHVWAMLPAMYFLGLTFARRRYA
ncbi:MAG TPA: hypothetical protein VF981_14050 [Gemmatimonadaceae bacterium]